MYLVLSIVDGGQRGTSHAFGREGGTIGRSAACDWTLSDPTNTVSGRHAVVGFADGAFIITDTSTNGTYLNGSPTPIGKGHTAPLRNGDRLVVGNMTIAVEVDEQPRQRTSQVAMQTARPHAGGDILSGLSAATSDGTGDPLNALGGVPAGQRAVSGRSSRGIDDIVGAGAPRQEFAPAPARRPQATPSSEPAQPVATSSPVPTAGGQAIPDHLSVEYLLSGSSPAQPAEPGPPAAAQPQRVPSAPPPGDGMAAPPEPAARPDGTELSPALRANYVALGNGREDDTGTGREATALDPVSILRQRSESRERARAAPAQQPSPARAPAVPPQPSATPVQAPLPAAQLAADVSDKTADASDETALAAAMPLPASTPVSEAKARDNAGAEAVAFWEGLGVDPNNVPEDRRAELLGEVGRTLRELGQGLVEVLAARRSVKEEFRMEQTHLQATENNPFKFFTSGEKALARIIVGEEGYMPLDEAVRQSLEDIRAHEVAAMAALQAAVSHVLDQLDPRTLERTGGQRGAFGRGADRKALWERYVALHSELSEDIEGTSKGVVTSAFMEAYERQLGQMRGEG